MTAHVNDYVTKGDIVMTRDQKICVFIEHYSLILEGAQSGQQIKLIKFQRKFILDVFDNPHSARRSYLSVARKDDKSAIIAAMLLVLLRVTLDRL